MLRWSRPSESQAHFATLPGVQKVLGAWHCSCIDGHDAASPGPARGHGLVGPVLRQYLFVVPESRTVIVRFGEGYGDVDWTSLFFRIAAGL
jgi:hypothetical protein